MSFSRSLTPCAPRELPLWRNYIHNTQPRVFALTRTPKSSFFSPLWALDRKVRRASAFTSHCELTLTARNSEPLSLVSFGWLQKTLAKPEPTYLSMPSELNANVHWRDKKCLESRSGYSSKELPPTNPLPTHPPPGKPGLGREEPVLVFSLTKTEGSPDSEWQRMTRKEGRNRKIGVEHLKC